MRLALAAAGLSVLLTSWPAASQGGDLTADVGGMRVELSSTPARPMTGTATIYRVRVIGADGRPASDLKVTLGGRMADGMAVLAPLRPAGDPGVYEGRVLYTMEGRWNLIVRVADKVRRLELPLTEHVGR